MDKATGQMIPVGSLVRPHRLCQTLEVISREGGDALNNGSLTTIFAEDLNALGAIISEHDLKNYKYVLLCTLFALLFYIDILCG